MESVLFSLNSKALTRRRVIACFALLSFLFLSSAGVLHHHSNSESAATCTVCHAIHAPLVQRASVSNLSAPRVERWFVSVAPLSAEFELIVRHSPPRAPPV